MSDKSERPRDVKAREAWQAKSKAAKKQPSQGGPDRFTKVWRPGDPGEQGAPPKLPPETTQPPSSPPVDKPTTNPPNEKPEGSGGG